MLIGGDDISNDTITLGTCFSMFVYILTRFCFVLIGENQTPQLTGSHKRIGGAGIHIPETQLQALLSPPTRVPQRACLQAIQFATLFKKRDLVL